MIIPKGALLTITTGEYSDYAIRGVFRAKVDIDAYGLRDKWVEEHPEQAKDYEFNITKFLAHAYKAGIIENVDCYEWHLSDYGSCSHMVVDKLDGEIDDFS